MSWRDRANEVICDVLNELPRDATVEQCRKALSDAYPFGERRMHPYKVWLDAVQRHLRGRFPELRREYEQARLQKELDKRGGMVTRGQGAQLSMF